MNIRYQLILLAMCSGVAACSPLAPRVDSSKYFILTPFTDAGGYAATPVSTTSDPQIAIGLGPIDFPDYLRRLEVVRRADRNEIYLSAEKRWGEPLDKNFNRVLSEDLARLLKTQRIEKYPWARRTQVDYQIVIDVQRFETGSDGQSQLIARWIIKNARDGKDLYASETVASTPVSSGDTGESVALSNDLAVLSRAIATQVIHLNRQRSESAKTARVSHFAARPSRYSSQRNSID